MSVTDGIFSNLKENYNNPDFVKEQQSLANVIGIPTDAAISQVYDALNTQVERIDGINNIQNKQFQLIINRLFVINDQITALSNGTKITVPSIENSPLEVDGSNIILPPTSAPPANTPGTGTTGGTSTPTTVTWKLTTENILTIKGLVVPKVKIGDFSLTGKSDDFSKVEDATITEVKFYLKNNDYSATSLDFLFNKISFIQYSGLVIAHKVIDQLKNDHYFDNKKFLEGYGWVGVSS